MSMPPPSPPPPPPGYEPSGPAYDSSKKVLAGIMGILFGGLGIHKFVLGYTKAGVTMLLVSVLGAILIIPALVMGIIGFVEGIIYLTKSDADFYATYVANEKHWF